MPTLLFETLLAVTAAFTLSLTTPASPLPLLPSSSYTEWRSARATYYAAAEPGDPVGGACGYGDLEKMGYGKATAALSSVLFEKGLEVVYPWDFYYSYYGFEADAGGHCNFPNAHFVLPIEAFEKIAIWKAFNMPIQYRRVKGRKEGGIRFAVNGAGIFLSVLISNVAGAGDIVAVKIKGSRTGWLPMGRNWGQTWHINADLRINLFHLRSLIVME